jgi:23S rRNA-/tRNA-specific pseudouridylate synthase
VTIKLSSPATHQFWEIPVLYEDEHLLALAKPAGMLTSPNRNAGDQPSLMALLHAGVTAGKPWAAERHLTYLANVHRLDPETSGVLLLARSKPALMKLASFLGSEQPCQKYLVLVQGTPAEDRFEVDAKLAAVSVPQSLGGDPPPPDPGEPGQSSPDTMPKAYVDSRHGKRARSVFLVRERFPRWTLLECQPLTTRPHQLRAHLRYVRLPIAGDSLYGGRSLWLSRLKPGYRLKPKHTERPLLGQPLLHLAELTFPHPVTGQPVTVTAPLLPKDLEVALKYLRRYGNEERGAPEAPEASEA